MLAGSQTWEGSSKSFGSSQETSIFIRGQGKIPPGRGGILKFSNGFGNVMGGTGRNAKGLEFPDSINVEGASCCQVFYMGREFEVKGQITLSIFKVLTWVILGNEWGVRNECRKL